MVMRWRLVCIQWTLEIEGYELETSSIHLLVPLGFQIYTLASKL